MVSRCINFLIIGLLSLWSLPTLMAQEADTIVALAAVEVSANRFLLPLKISGDTSRLPSFFLSDAAQQISYNNAASIRSYGPGVLQTLSINGLGAQHTAIIWEGFNLQSSMNGVFDLSLLPIFQSQRIAVSIGGSSAFFGSGGMAGAIILQTQDDTHPSLEYTANTMYNNQLQATIGYQIGKVRLKTRMFSRIDANKYAFFARDSKGNQNKQKRVNAPGELYGIQQSADYQFGKQKIALRFWTQEGQRQIPPSIIASNSGAFQADNLSNLLLRWNMELERLQVQFESGYFAERIRYRQEIGDIYSDTKAIRWVNRLQLIGGSPATLRYRFGLQYHAESAHSDTYTDNPHRNHFAGWAGIEKSNTAWEWQAHVRYNQYQQDPGRFFSGLFSVTRKLGVHHSIKLNLSRDFQIPTLNDLFWIPGGNPNLQHEKSWHTSLHYAHKQQFGKHQLGGNLQIFNYFVSDWIRWQPNNQSGLWEPSNLDKVWSRGINATIFWNYVLPQTTLGISCKPYLGVSTQSLGGFRNLADLWAGEQLIYTPRVRAAFTFHLQHQHWQFLYRHQYTGLRNTQADGSNTLPNWQTGGVEIRRNGLPFFHFQMHLRFSVENLFNEAYESIPFYPQPLRFFQFGCKLDLIQP